MLKQKYDVVKDLSIFTMIEHLLLMYYDKGWGYKEWHNERGPTKIE